MSQLYLLDTNICVHYLKGEFGIRERIQLVGLRNCFLSEITIAELLFGVANSAPTWQAKRRQEVQDLRESFTGRELLINSLLEKFAEVKAHLRQLGRSVDSFDLLIGATALANNLTVVTRNTRHFADMPGIMLEDWSRFSVTVAPYSWWLQGEFDRLIGRVAVAHGFTLVTQNTRHSADMVGIGLEDWAQDYEAGQPVK